MLIAKSFRLTLIKNHLLGNGNFRGVMWRLRGPRKSVFNKQRVAIKSVYNSMLCFFVLLYEYRNGIIYDIGVLKNQKNSL